ncbi:hypothetical protein JCM8097_006707 [Rhodosporidiobolus ruineniae]
MPLFNSSNPWASRSDSSAPSRASQPRTAAPPRRPNSRSASPRPRPEQAKQQSEQQQQDEQPPADERTQRLNQLAALRTKFTSLQSGFRPPSLAELSFLPTSTAFNPKLAFTKQNAPVHAYEEALTRLLTELDGVESGGDPEVRGERKKLVVEVEKELERVEREVRKKAWEVQHEGGGKAEEKGVEVDGGKNGPADDGNDAQESVETATTANSAPTLAPPVSAPSATHPAPSPTPAKLASSVPSGSPFLSQYDRDQLERGDEYLRRQQQQEPSYARAAGDFSDPYRNPTASSARRQPSRSPQRPYAVDEDSREDYATARRRAYEQAQARAEQERAERARLASMRGRGGYGGGGYGGPPRGGYGGGLWGGYPVQGGGYGPPRGGFGGGFGGARGSGSPWGMW